MDGPSIVGKDDLTKSYTQIDTIFPASVIVRFYEFIKKSVTTDVEFNPSMIKEIDQYIDLNSPRWIYSPILRSNPDSRYIVFLMHYFDRNPGMQMIINSELSDSTLKQIEEMKKSFKLGC
ncbi:MAG: hypothetical protein GPJ54_04055 [Candidatus Heimdallarchaeota archaeon]|nr:hypothetical protein [Candidatus Heimdallarchaeota archaeon]